MKTRFWKSAVCLVLICVLAFSLTGCDSLDYREAVELYNAQKYEAAAEIFYALGDYEDSTTLYTRCQYWTAIELMEHGLYKEALPRFLKLAGFEDSDQRVTECRYQLALAAFQSGDWDTAEHYFQDTPDYRKTAEYCRQILWQRLFDAIAAAAPDGAEAILSKEADGCTVQVIARSTETPELIFSVSEVKDMGYVFTDDLLLRFTRDSLQATFAAESSFTMDFKGGQIGSRQTGSGTLNIPTCTPETPLVLESFDMTVTDNLGKTTSTTDPAECLMGETMAENFALMLETVPGILADAGITQTLADIGFAALS